MHKLEVEKNKAEAKAAVLKSQPLFPNVEQLNELLVKSLQSEFLKILSTNDFSSSLPTELKDLPSKFINLTEEKDKGKKALSLEEAEKKSTKSDFDDETHVTGSMVESSRIKNLKKFDFVTKEGKHIHLIEEQINQQKNVEEEAKAEAAKRKSEVRKEEFVDLLGPDVVNKAESKITNYDVLTKKVPITLKVYKEDGTSEVISNFKAINLHLGEWRKVVKACPNKTIKGWQTIYGQIKTIMDYLHTTKAELGINLDIPLSQQDPLDKSNDLANKKRKLADDIHDYFKANKRLKS
ncbi:hypothetical protein Tco_1226849 [Tanacetum coccineum]